MGLTERWGEKEGTITSVWEVWTCQDKQPLESLSLGKASLPLGCSRRKLAPDLPSPAALPTAHCRRRFPPVGGMLCATQEALWSLGLSEIEPGIVLLLGREVPAAVSAQCARCPSLAVFFPLTELADGSSPGSACCESFPLAAFVINLSHSPWPHKLLQITTFAAVLSGNLLVVAYFSLCLCFHLFIFFHLPASPAAFQ